jgi:hypothetical protein
MTKLLKLTALMNGITFFLFAGTVPGVAFSMNDIKVLDPTLNLDSQFDQKPPLRLIFRRDGILTDLENRAIHVDNLRDREVTIQIAPGLNVSFVTIERTLQDVEKQAVKKLTLLAPAYVFAAGQLFYSVPVNTGVQFSRPTDAPPGAPRHYPAGTDASVIQGYDTSVRPAELIIDLANLAKLGKPSGNSGIVLRYLICVSANGEIQTVLSQNPPARDITEIAAALKQVRVKSPGQRNGKPVPTAVPVFVPLK